MRDAATSTRTCSSPSATVSPSHLPDQSVDVVVSFETIEHHDQHEAMLREMKRVLGPGGTLIISSPDKHEYSDVPGYRNPFHVRELYRNEFEDLLGAYFRHVSLAGQRIKAGSLIWPIEADDSRSFSGYEAGEATGDVRPIGAPLYLIAAASDEPTPPLPAGLLDGGAFVWSTDHVNAFQSAETHYQTHFRQLSDARAQAEAHAAATQDALAASQERLSELELSVAEADRQRRRPSSTMTSAWRRQARSTTAAAEAIKRPRGRERDRQASELDTLGRERIRLATELRVMESSHSWRMTAPFRSLRRAMQRAAAAACDVPPGRPRHVSGTPAVRADPAQDQERALPHLPVPLPPNQHLPRLGGLPPDERAAAGGGPLSPAVRPHADGSLPAWFYADAENEYVPIAQSADVDTRIKAIAFYLPQFHPIPENDRWWGKGFTEWTNVSRGKPQFAGHYQPHLPGELGFYDLRIPRRAAPADRAGEDVRAVRVLLSLSTGSAAERLLRQPLDQLLANPDMDFPFCLCWANENWTRRWDGQESEILIGQQHSPADDLAFIQDIEPVLRDPRYIRVDGRPAAGGLPAGPAARRPRHGGALAQLLPREWHRRSVSQSAPTRSTGSIPDSSGSTRRWSLRRTTLVRRRRPRASPRLNPEFQGTIYDYQYLVEHSRTYQAPASSVLFRSVTPMWDNEARQPGRGTVFAHSSPARYREMLENACGYTEQQFEPERRFVFINAWNEWAEGAHLEPDRRYGYAYLQATADALRRFPAAGHRTPIVVVSHDAHFHGAQLLALTLVRTLSERLGYDVEILLCGSGPLRAELERYGRVHDFFSPESTPTVRRTIIHELYASGARIALCNTSVVGSTVELLAEAGFAVVSMIHELPGAHQATWSRELYFVDRPGSGPRGVSGASRSRPLRGADGPAPDAGSGEAAGSAGPESFQRSTRARPGSCCATSSEPVRIRPSPSAWATPIAGRAWTCSSKPDIALLTTIPDLLMVWVGYADAETLAAAEARITETGSGDHFLFPGQVEEPDVFFAGADVYLMTSREDPFPLVVLHALDAEHPGDWLRGRGRLRRAAEPRVRHSRAVSRRGRDGGRGQPGADPARRARAAGGDRTRDHRS